MERIQSVLKNLQEALASLKDIVQKNALARQKAVELQNEMQEKLIVLEDREKVVVEKERLIQTVEELIERERLLANAESDFQTRQKAFDARCERKLVSFDEREAEYQEKLQALREREEALVKEKKEYKDRILASISE